MSQRTGKEDKSDEELNQLSRVTIGRNHQGASSGDSTAQTKFKTRQ